MVLKTIDRMASLKGLDVVGTGDTTHPKWLDEIKENLIEVYDGIYQLKEGKIFFVLSVEISTIYREGDRLCRIHHVILEPDMEYVEQFNGELSKFGDLSLDGRPVVNLTSQELVELAKEIDEWCEIFPAHAWTPHYSIFGVHGYDSMRECYGKYVNEVYALETGLSSDPPMNWRVSKLDRFTLVSNSDAHSPWPWRLGREANVFELEDLSYREIVRSIRGGKILFTIETYPEYGKYHFSGHRECGLSFSPEEEKALEYICPRCGRPLTKGVLRRVEELADRPDHYRPKDRPKYYHLIPLTELIAKSEGISSLSARRVWDIYTSIVRKYCSEYAVLLDVDINELKKDVGVRLAKMIEAVREDRVKLKPGYDGVYGEIIFNENTH